MSNSSTVVTIRGLKATEEGKPASVKVSFSVKKTGKTSKYSYVSKVNVIEDKQTIAASQTKLKAITVTSNKSMEGMTIKVTKGNADVTFTSELSADGKSAILSFAGDLAAADYLVTVGDMTATVKCEASKIDSVEITSDVVAMNGIVGSTGTKEGYAGYVVKNQFGDDITSKVSVTTHTSAKSVTATSGKLTFTWDSEPRLNDVVSVVIMCQGTDKSASKTLKVSDQATPYTVEKYGVYNEDGKTLSATNAKTDDFYYLFRVKDQYGNYMDPTDVRSAIRPSAGASASMYVNVAFGLTDLTIDTTDPKTVKVDGVKYVGYLIEQDDSNTITDIAPGAATIMLTPGGSGNTLTDTITVANGSTVTNLTVTVPTSVPRASEVLLDFKATDAEGNEVKDYATLSKITSSNTNFTWVKRDGVTKIKLNSSGATPGSVISTVFTLQNYSTVVVTVNVLEAPVLTGVTKIASWVPTATLSGSALSISTKNLTGEDQYGNALEVNACLANSAAGGLTGGNVYLMVVPEDDSNDVFTEPATTYTYKADNNATTTSQAIVLGKNDTFTVTGAGIGTEDYTFKVVEAKDASTVQDYKTNISLVEKNITAGSAYTFTLTSTQASKYKSYVVEGPDAVYADTHVTASGIYSTSSSYEAEVKVYGVISGGSKVRLSEGTSGYTYKIVAGANTDNGSSGKIKAKVNEKKISPSTPSVEGSYTVVINQTGEEITKTVKVDTSGVGVKELKFINPFQTSIYSRTATVSGDAILDQLKGTDTYGFALKDTDGTTDKAVKFADSSIKVNEKVTVVFSDINRIPTSSGSITNNGGLAKDAVITGVAGDSCTVTIKAGDKAIFTTTISW